MISKRPILVRFIDRSPRVVLSGPAAGSVEGTSISRKWPPQRILVSGGEAVKPGIFPLRSVYLLGFPLVATEQPGRSGCFDVYCCGRIGRCPCPGAIGS